MKTINTIAKRNLAGGVRNAILANMADPKGLVAEGGHFRIVRVEVNEKTGNTPAGPMNNPGASYSSFATIIDVELRSWEYRALFRVALTGNLRGFEALNSTIETMADVIDKVSLFDRNGDELICDLQDMAIQQGTDDVEAELRKLVMSTRIVAQITLCGRCDGTGDEPERLGEGTCKLCKGDGREPKRQAAEADAAGQFHYGKLGK